MCIFPVLSPFSGLGPAEHLKEHGIPLVKDLPGVGSHLVRFTDRYNDPFPDILSP